MLRAESSMLVRTPDLEYSINKKNLTSLMQTDFFALSQLFFASYERILHKSMHLQFDKFLPLLAEKSIMKILKFGHIETMEDDFIFLKFIYVINFSEKFVLKSSILGEFYSNSG